MELHQLKYFKAVAQCGKISEAAQSLFISAPALSTSISRLEQELGVCLFDRTSNRIILNAQGQIFLKRVNQILSTLDEAKRELQLSVLHQTPHVSIASINSIMWVNLIAAFTSEFPNYTLSCSTISRSLLQQAGLSARHNFLLACESDLPSGYAAELDSILLFQSHPSVMVHKDHPLAKEDVIDIPMLAEEKLLMPMPGEPLHNRILQLFELNKLSFSTENAYSYLVRQKLVAENVGISFLSNHPSYAPLPGIRCIPRADPLDPWNARLYWSKARPLTEHDRTFRDYVEHFYRDQHNI